MLKTHIFLLNRTFPHISGHRVWSKALRGKALQNKLEGSVRTRPAFDQVFLSQDLDEDMTMPELFSDEPFVSGPPPRLLRPDQPEPAHEVERPVASPLRTTLKRWAIRKLKVRSSAFY